MSLKENDQGIDFVKTKGKEAQAFYKKYGRWVQVNRRRYDIILCDRLVYMESHVLGLCDTHTRVLYINKHCNNIASTLIHEIGHAEAHESGFKQRNNWCSDNEEHFVETMGESITYNYELVRKRA
jgi:hypothetical protein